MAKRKRAYGSTKAAHREQAGSALFMFRKASSRIGAEMAKTSPDCATVLEFYTRAAKQAGRYIAQRGGEGAALRHGRGVMKKLIGLETRVYKRCIVKRKRG